MGGSKKGKKPKRVTKRRMRSVMKDAASPPPADTGGASMTPPATDPTQGNPVNGTDTPKMGM